MTLSSRHRIRNSSPGGACLEPTSSARSRDQADTTTRNIKPMLVWSWSSVAEAGPTSTQHWFNVSCLLGISHDLFARHWADFSQRLARLRSALNILYQLQSRLQVFALSKGGRDHLRHVAVASQTLRHSVDLHESCPGSRDAARVDPGRGGVGSINFTRPDF